MSTGARHCPHSWALEPRWPALVAVLSVGGIYAALPHYLVLGPRWLFPGIVFGLLVPTIVTHVREHHVLNRFFGFTVNAVVTVCLIASVALLIEELPTHKESPTKLLLSAGSSCVSHIRVFSL